MLTKYKKVYCSNCGKEISEMEEVREINNFTLEELLDAPKLCYKCLNNFNKNKKVDKNE